MLNRTSLAWSRDGTEKIYVQTLLEQDGAEAFRWLEQGAAIYICGDATRMAADVDVGVERTLLDVIARHGGLSSEEASRYLDRLSSEHRYQRDVYYEPCSFHPPQQTGRPSEIFPDGRR
ncbi:hypothetical protein [Aliiruegeria lutimaris]|uniref:Sulfite reductase (NADPH) flavoprotein alpha-component n=1 Tax=Aliiruegeria lutimaris TaxID=571298 RepID=A0A1G8SLN2_9RHOB|nr:hypothetical protein [Aliiruegeria lutimaris]SDJ30127.1 sulfite reductase (NADPH) flavoprotein alpha-component [Aliiruegeria lutimaris]